MSKGFLQEIKGLASSIKYGQLTKGQLKSLGMIEQGLQQQIDELEFLVGTDLKVLSAEVTRLQAENKRLREGLKLYGDHTKLCRGRNIKCTCGLEQALKGVKNES